MLATVIDNVREFFKEITPARLGTLGFNLTAFGWVGMSLALGPSGWPMFLPCSYLHPNIMNLVSSVVMVFGTAISIMAIRRGNVVGPVIALTLLWSIVATVLREMGLLNGAFIS